MVQKEISINEIKLGLKPLFPRLWRYCLVITGNHDSANDLAQSACMRALEKADQFKPGTRIDHWVFRIAQRIWLNELRAASVRRGGGMAVLEEQHLPDPAPGPEENLGVREILMQVFTLPEAQRVAFLLVYVEEYSYRETASILDIPVGTVMSRLSAARSKLMNKLNPLERQAL